MLHFGNTAHTRRSVSSHERLNSIDQIASMHKLVPDELFANAEPAMEEAYLKEELHSVYLSTHLVVQLFFFALSSYLEIMLQLV